MAQIAPKEAAHELPVLLKYGSIQAQIVAADVYRLLQRMARDLRCRLLQDEIARRHPQGKEDQSNDHEDHQDVEKSTTDDVLLHG